MNSNFDEQKFRDYMRSRDVKAKNIDRYVFSIESLMRTWNVMEPTQEAAIALRAAMKDMGRKPASINLYLNLLQWWAKSTGMPALDLSDDGSCPLMKVVWEPRPVPSLDAIHNILNDPVFMASPRDYPLVVFALETGCRRGEVAAAKFLDFERDPRTHQPTNKLWVYNENDPVVKTAKNGKKELISLSPIAMDVLNRWRNDPNGRPYLYHEGISGDYIFLGRKGKPLTPDAVGKAVRRWRLYFESKGYIAPGEKWSAHVLRHLWTTKRYLKDRWDEFELQEAGRWSSGTMVKRYIGSLSKEIEAKTAKVSAW